MTNTCQDIMSSGQTTQKNSENTQKIAVFISTILLSSSSPIILAIDGKSASGKTSLASKIANEYDCNVFHTDDFFLPKELRTPERLSEIGGNVHYERIKTDLIENVILNRDFSYRPFDCKSMTLGECVNVRHKRLNILEGVYSFHSTFNSKITAQIYLRISENKQLERLRAREPEFKLKRYIEEWIPLENMYFNMIENKYFDQNLSKNNDLNEKNQPASEKIISLCLAD